MRVSEWFRWIFISIFTTGGFISGALIEKTIVDTIFGTVFMFIVSLICVTVVVRILRFVYHSTLSGLRRFASRLTVEPDEQ